jgi:alpha-beta hydrolase superfamily lysophospholipase
MKFARIRTLLLVVFGLVAGLYALYRLFFRLLEHAMLKTRANTGETPAGSGLDFEEIDLLSGNRHLQAWNVPAAASNDTQKAVLIFHGIDESIADWIPALGYLHGQGISALVFDYSGFGNSQGRPSIANLRQDAQAAYDAFLSKAPQAAPRVVLGYSLGTGVLLDAVSRFSPPPDALALVAAYSSGRDAAVRLGPLPASLSFVIPDVYNNVREVQRMHIPLLIVHSREDELFPTWMPVMIHAAANEPKRLVLLEGLKHGDMLEGRANEYLAPVAEYESF